MNPGIAALRTASLAAALVALSFAPPQTLAEAGQQGQRGAGPATARASAPIDLTGYWTALITEDWHVRMLNAPKGDFGTGANGAVRTPGGERIAIAPNFSDQGNIPFTEAGTKAAMSWDPARDEAEGNRCKAYGAPAILRQPTHLRISWQDDNTLKMETDYGTQTRLFHFGPPPQPGRMSYVGGRYVPGEEFSTDAPAGTQPSEQGHSAAMWRTAGGGGLIERGGSLKAVTTRLKPGYYWKNGMPYTGNAVLTETFRVFRSPDNTMYMTVGLMVEDPEYLNQPFVVNYHFKKLPDGSRWNPTPCSVR
jgi:hypothetical protein